MLRNLGKLLSLMLAANAIRLDVDRASQELKGHWGRIKNRMSSARSPLEVVVSTPSCQFPCGAKDIEIAWLDMKSQVTNSSFLVGEGEGIEYAPNPSECLSSCGVLMSPNGSCRDNWRAKVSKTIDAGKGVELKLCCRISSCSAQDFEIQIASGSTIRHALVHVPENVSGEVPLVLNYHPMALYSRYWREFTQYDRLADKRGFVVVYPQGGAPALLNVLAKTVPNFPDWMEQGSGYTWNGGTCCPGATTQKVDDVRFTKDLLSYLKEVAIPQFTKGRLTIDPTRVYGIVGSNGAFMVLRLACQEPNLFAAITAGAAVLANESGSLDRRIGTWPLDPFTCATRNRPVPTLLVQGTWDPLVPPMGQPFFGFRSVQSNVQLMKRLNGISEDNYGTMSYKKRRSTCISYGGKERNVTYCEVKRMGHTWPMKDIRCKAQIAMPGAWCSTSIDINEQSWEFFKQYRMSLPEPADNNENDTDGVTKVESDVGVIEKTGTEGEV